MEVIIDGMPINELSSIPGRLTDIHKNRWKRYEKLGRQGRRRSALRESMARKAGAFAG
jgi:hypothetical protein